MAFAVSGSTDDFGSYFQNRFQDKLLGRHLKVEKVVKGIRLPLNSIIVTANYEWIENDPPPLLSLTISFRRGDLTTDFVDKFFDPRNKNIRVVHSFAARGVETVLRPEGLTITLHDGVGLHLRNEVPYLPGFRTFRSDGVVGTVVDVGGDIYVSMDRETIRERLSDVWDFQLKPMLRCSVSNTCKKDARGGYLITWEHDERDLNPFYAPRIETK